MRVAIIGGGISGLGAAWCLHPLAEVTVYEREPRIGGHAYTVEVPFEGGAVAIDLGFIIFNEWIYPHFDALLRRLDVPTQTTALTVGVSAGGDEWSTNFRRTPFWARMAPEADRFARACPHLFRLAPGVSVREYLEAHGYSRDFQQKCVAPLLSYMFVTRSALLEMPAQVAGWMFNRDLSLHTPMLWRTVTGGARAYLQKLSAPLADHLRTGTAVRSVRRDDQGVTVVDQAGHEDRFDRLILATHAPDALALLGEGATAEERELLSSVRMESCTMVVHREPAVMPRTRLLWSSMNYVVGEERRGDGDLDGLITYYAGAPIFRTIDPPESLVPPAARLAEASFRHSIYDTRWHLLRPRIAALQGQRRTWWAGGHLASTPFHESAFLSGISAAMQLGAPYPFPDDAPARALFERYALGPGMPAFFGGPGAASVF